MSKGQLAIEVTQIKCRFCEKPVGVFLKSLANQGLATRRKFTQEELYAMRDGTDFVAHYDCVQSYLAGWNASL